ncbi:hypothetical protein WL639_03630 [Staphylococcus hominis]|uniref:hypothetical protein n=1 Tax=Staphylococcus hominis TaxID=1290 RepID=UPI0030BE9BB5
MDILTIEGVEIYINSLGLRDQKLIYRTELKKESEAAQKIEKYLNNHYLNYSRLVDHNYNDYKYLYTVTMFNGFNTLIGFKFSSVMI